MSTAAATPSLPTIYRHARRLAKQLPYEPSRAARSLRRHVEDELYRVQKRTFPADKDPAHLWRQVQALQVLVSNEAMNQFPLSKRISEPEGTPHHYKDLAANAGDMNAPSRRTPLQSFLFKWFRFKA
ncbi:hypothetical protein AMAG_00473 [Allomyces macrogynus ATCC 38327]|uniref:Uncharacterized protein n=1 Tax=Allomyces macrogynus (strain ATCC 38327) TaxID=578462 RepID=A0A0L0RWT3_ALLM3|nr:hypothetical protein AMAG_00473 [Allomyces macrogynus ATCC 38327]|eukprot:KNE54501.1 hypothetical protein AMAG_00473 [Allomyces macrogynus ATCC 38327]